MNALLVLHVDEDQHLLLPDVARELTSMGIRSRCVWDIEPQLKHRLWTAGKQTAVVSLRPIRKFRPDWASPILEQSKLNKIQECEGLDRVGIPVPKWREIKRGEEPDLSDFEEFVVVKPAFGARGAFVRILRRNRVRWRPVDIEHRRTETDSLIAQQYIYTGPWPTNYRVAMIFGEPIYAWRQIADPKRTPFDLNLKGSTFFEGRTIVASSKGCTMDGEVPQEIIEFAQKAYRAFPDIPLLATDIVRDANTGKLYFLELNTAGWSLCISSDMRADLIRQFGLDIMTQFGGSKAVARGIFRRLAEKRKNAKVTAFQEELCLSS